MSLKRYSLITRSAKTIDFASLNEVFEISKKTPDAFMVFDNKAQPGEIEAWVLRDDKWCACEICGDTRLPDRIVKMLW